MAHGKICRGGKNSVVILPFNNYLHIPQCQINRFNNYLYCTMYNIAGKWIIILLLLCQTIKYD